MKISFGSKYFQALQYHIAVISEEKNFQYM
jgi:hypothetical protein